MQEKTCEICSKPVEARRGSKKYCSVNCRQIAAWFRKEPVENLIVLLGKRLIEESNLPDKEANIFTLCERWIRESRKLRST